ncbi:endonuclease/exonuclease/phosphatase family protein [Echinicola sp. 20G]|uniref:endonuclease/exonuclease/phosphatase family protein n=1 Tax=Echinicola sp. 20G TaxID=2781961 RepID=UPI001910BA97|nr:endonuclease/exonuclease/phosphatase family protein [Echinicola sp. 20G]
MNRFKGRFGLLFNTWIGIILLLFQMPLQAQHIKVMSYNIHHGADRNEVLTYREIGRFIKSSGVDIVGLQEVDSICNRSGNSDQMKVLAEITGKKSVFGRHFAFDGGAYGLGILSKYPLEDIRNDRITSIRANGEKASLALLSAKVLLPGGKAVRFATVHFALDQATRLVQAKEVIEYLGEDIPVILTGDLNAEPETKEIGLLNQYFELSQGNDAYTFPEKDPVKKIDYILVSKGKVSKTMKSVVVTGNTLSDHLPIISEIILD